ncbi:4-(cytidine 5'-diphospho)-2-C-methyl-D-erythritol kinase [Mesorhizobium australicum]|uniref:4-diphosphocytidyl-2-C-methyl-D-erythritol kinase n=1 Tax=Mesorhizobium australicum TaxID=536018 RepID=A0A1X7NST0_9HYPH|nr:4-(cytidine 5'-diphospho)-2-C-methyl-D-erythritol kinase [Mesorhizobium australicum]SMH41144.1 4-diphosphocytidyl-2-C-methyl-D-erythritol kinase [Mesorhizobium australicum]
MTAVLAPAKLNLALHVTGRRPDGYHLLDSLVAFTRFGDRVTIAPSDENRFEITGPYAEGLPLDDSNLVLRALNTMRAEFGRADPVHIALEKNLPVASGVGGGSSDAAAVLHGLARLWDLSPDDNRLARIGLGLGADVPMCLAARPLLARGIGEEITPVDGFPSLGIVLVNPGVALSTAAVFAALASRDSEPLPTLPGRLDFHTLCNWLETTRNDLEAPARALEPAIGETLAALRKAGAHFVRMSGSGATCFGLFESGNLAKRAASEIRKRRPGWFVAATRNTISGDMPA